MLAACKTLALALRSKVRILWLFPWPPAIVGAGELVVPTQSWQETAPRPAPRALSSPLWQRPILSNAPSFKAFRDDALESGARATRSLRLE